MAAHPPGLIPGPRSRSLSERLNGGCYAGAEAGGPVRVTSSTGLPTAPLVTGLR
jgi:hypothetical protein